MLDDKQLATLKKKALKFLADKSTDHKGRTVSDYLNFTEQEMHDTHDWIQWAFPIDTVSIHNLEAGLIDHCGRSFAYNTIRYQNNYKLVNHYLSSIGIFVLIHSQHATDVNKFFTAVPNASDHHMKRISRVLRHLMLTGFDYKAKHLLSTIMRELILPYPQQFDSYTVAYWNAIVYDYNSIP